MYKNFEDELEDFQPTHELQFCQPRKLAGRFINRHNEDNELELPEPKYKNNETDEATGIENITSIMRSLNMNSSRNEFLNIKKTLPTLTSKQKTLQNGSLTILLAEEFFKFPPPKASESELSKVEHEQGEQENKIGIQKQMPFNDSTVSDDIYSSFNSNSTKSSSYHTAFDCSIPEDYGL